MKESISTKLYPGQPSSEITQKVIYKHVVFIMPFVAFLLIMLLFIVLFSVFYIVNPDFFGDYVNSPIISLFGFFILFITVFIFLAVIWIWRNNKIIITNEHIVDVDQIGLFSRNVSTLRLGEIQDISASVHGPSQMILKYGTIVIQTAGERANFVFDYVPSPYEVEHYILETRKKYLHRSRRRHK